MSAGWVALLAVTLTMACSVDPGLKRVPAANVRMLSLTGRAGHASPDDVDVSLTKDADLTVFWASHQVGGRHDADQVWQARLAGDWSRWEAPARIDSVTSGSRVAVRGSAVHLLAYQDPIHRVVHLIDPGGTGAWRNLGSVARTADGEEAYDGVLLDSLLVVAYLGYRQPSEDTPFDSLNVVLVAAEIPPHGHTTYHELAAFPHFNLMSGVWPHLATWHGEVHLVCTVGDWHSPFRTLHAYRAAAGGWSAVTDLALSAPYGKSDVALAATRDRLFLFFQGRGLEATESTDGRHWSPVTGWANAHFSGQSSRGRNIAASADSDAVLVAWLDDGIVPTTQLPLIGDPIVEQNVIAVASMGHPATLANLVSSPLIRVTPTSGFLNGVAAHSGHGWHAIAWIRDDGLPGSDVKIGVARLPASSR